MSTPLVRVSGLTKTYGRFVALQEVAFSIREGEVLGLIGPNGAGKTTLFECVAGVLPANRLMISRGDCPLTDRERLALLFYLPDAVAPWPAETVAWALEFTVGFFGGRQDARGEVIDRLQLEPLLQKRIGALSKGQRKRVLLAIGLLAPQPLLLVDEPFEGLDLRQGRDVAAALRDHARSGRTLFLSIHQIAEAARICDRFVLISAGTVRGEGTLDELRRHAAQHAPAPPADLEDVVLALT